MVRRESSGFGSTTGGLFLESRRGETKETERGRSRSRSRTPDDIWGEEEGDGKEEERYNENGSAVKRRRTGDSSTSSLFEGQEDEKGGDKKKAGDKTESHTKPKTSGPFIDESDSEEDFDAFREVEETVTPTTAANATDEPAKSNADDQPTRDIPPLVREATSHIEDEELANFDDLGEGEQEDFLGPQSPAGNECEEEAVCPICQASLFGLSEVVRPFMCC